jgi:arylsulfatase A-like enzyme
VAVLALACGGSDPGEGGPIRLVRVVETAAGSLSTAGFATVEIARERRPVLAAQPRVPVRWREPVSLAGERWTSEVSLQGELRSAPLVRVEGWLEAGDRRAGDAPPRTAAEALTALARVRALRAPARIVDPDAGAVSLAFEIPEDLRGAPAFLSVVARPLPAEARVRFETRELAVPPRAQLEFGFAVEEAGWAEGWPAVRFALRAGRDAEAPVLFEQTLAPAAVAGDRRWFDVAVDLRAFAGRRLSLVFEAEALAQAAGVEVSRSLPVVSEPLVVVVDTAAPVPPNLVLVSLDTLRARSVGSYGDPHPTTPVLDRRMAGEGALLRQAVTPIAFTPPAHMTMLTGLEPCMHGVRGREGSLPAAQPILAEMLRAAGYRTAAFTEDAYVTVGLGFARGFDQYKERRESRAEGFAAETFADAQRWLAQARAGPFFLFVHTYEVHAPYEPPPEYRELFADGDAHAAAPKLRQQLRRYEQEIRYTDELMGGFLDALAARGLAGRTVVVVTSDHGEGFGEHWKAVGHGFDAHDEAVLVPLLIRAPGLVPPGLVVEEQVGLADLVPTLLELLGVPAPPDLAGRSFAGLLSGRAEGFEERPLVLETLGDQSGVRTRHTKLLEWEGGALRLYDLAADPGERRNLAASRPEAVAEARRVLAQHRAACEAWRRARPLDRDGGSERPWSDEDEIDAKLRALGYLE